MFSPDDKYIVTGAGATAKGGRGKLMFLEKNTLDIVKALEVDSTPVKVFWHSKINQVELNSSGMQHAYCVTRRLSLVYRAAKYVYYIRQKPR